MESEGFLLGENDWIWNRSVISMTTCRAVETRACGGSGAVFAALCAGNRSPEHSRDTVCDFHHDHPTAHEALCIVARSTVLGEAMRQLPGLASPSNGPSAIVFRALGDLHEHPPSTRSTGGLRAAALPMIAA